MALLIFLDRPTLHGSLYKEGISAKYEKVHPRTFNCEEQSASI